MFLVDSSGWIEFFIDGPRAEEYSKYLGNPEKVVTPTIVLYEVYKKIKRERREEDALSAVSIMNKTCVVPLSESTALMAADISLMHSLSMADAIVYATAFEKDCKVVTGDGHFKGLERVVFVE